MTWVKSFLVGLFSQHIGTKIMALVLSVLLFGFVQQTLTGHRQLDRLILKFEIADDLTDKYQVLTAPIVLTDVKLEGLRSKVDLIADGFERDPELTKIIDDRFVRLYESTVRINNDFLHQEKILDPNVDISWRTPEDVLLIVDRVRSRDYTITLASGAEDALQVKADNPYEGTAGGGGRVDPVFVPARVTVRGPERAFREEGAEFLRVRLDPVDRYLREQVRTAGPVRMDVASIDWESLVETSYLKSMVAQIPAGAYPAGKLAEQLQIEFEVRNRMAHKVVRLEIRYLVGPDGFDALKGYVVQGPEGPESFNQQHYETGVCDSFGIEVPQALRDSPELENLFLVLDIAHMQDEEATNSKKVPVFLDVKPGGDRELLKPVRIKITKQFANRVPVIAFRPKS